MITSFFCGKIENKRSVKYQSIWGEHGRYTPPNHRHLRSCHKTQIQISSNACYPYVFTQDYLHFYKISSTICIITQ